MNRKQKQKKLFYTIISCVLLLILLFGEAQIGGSQVGAKSVSAQSYLTLRVRVRYTDGTAASGVKVELYRQDLGLPDIYVRDCLVPNSGFCEFTLKPDVTHIIKFPRDQRLDPITAQAAGHSGIDGMGIVLRKNDYTMGFVLSKLAEEEADANWMLLDLAPEETAPQPRIPEGAVAEARKILEEEQTQEEVETYPAVTPIPTVEVVQITAPTIAVPELQTEGSGMEELTNENGGEIALSEIDLIDVDDVQDLSGDESVQAGENDRLNDAKGIEEDGRYFYQLVILAILVLALLFILGWIAVTIRDMRANNRSGK
jgi:hypothetical protein